MPLLPASDFLPKRRIITSRCQAALAAQFEIGCEPDPQSKNATHSPDSTDFADLKKSLEPERYGWLRDVRECRPQIGDVFIEFLSL
jgi:hypothetical protein